MCPSAARDRRQPRLDLDGVCGVATQHFEVRFVDALDRPTLRKCVAQLTLGDSSRASISGLALAEAEDEQVTSRSEDTMDTRRIPRAILVLEDMEDTGICCGIESLGIAAQVEDIFDLERGRDAGFRSLRSR